MNMKYIVKINTTNGNQSVTTLGLYLIRLTLFMLTDSEKLYINPYIQGL